MSIQGTNPQSVAPSESAPARPAHSYEFADLVELVQNQLGLIVRITMLVVAAAVIIVMLLPTRFSSSAVVILDQRKNTIADLTSVLSALPTDPASLQNQIQILQSRDLAAEVITKLKLYDDPEFNGSAQPSLIGAFLSALNPKTLARSEFCRRAGRRRGAARCNHRCFPVASLRGLARPVDDDHGHLRVARCRQGRAHRQHHRQYLCRRSGLIETAGHRGDERLADAAHPGSRQQVQSQETAALTYKAQNNLDSSPGGTSLVEAQMNGINTQLVQARADLAAKSAIYAEVTRSVKSGDLANISQVVASPADHPVAQPAGRSDAPAGRSCGALRRKQSQAHRGGNTTYRS